jgi:hypothetical protein
MALIIGRPRLRHHAGSMSVARGSRDGNKAGKWATAFNVTTGIPEKAGSWRRWSPRFFVVLLLTSVACVQALSTAADGDRLKIGRWGGEHAALTVTDAGARVEFDCAFGEINEPLTIDAAGRMAVNGVYVLERGPAREQPDSHPAHYSGRLSGDRLTFDVALIASNEPVGNFTVVDGAQPSGIIKCR